MSEIAKKIKGSAQEYLDGIGDPRNRDGSSLMAPEDLENDLREVLEWISGDSQFGDVKLPRFGLISLLMRSTPCYVYGHPAMKKDFGTTAFTDGVHIFICDDFYDKLLADSKKSKGNDYGIELLLMHEVMHIAFNHVKRLRQFPADIRNIATDLSINTKLQTGFPDLKWCNTLKEAGLGFKPGDVEKYPKMSEEAIAREIVIDRERKKKEEQKQQQQNGKNGQPQNQQGNQQGNQQPGQGQGQPQNQQGGQQPGQGQGQGQGQNPQGSQQPGQGQGQGQGQPQNQQGSQQPGQGQQGGNQQSGQSGGNGQGQQGGNQQGGQSGGNGQGQEQGEGNGPDNSGEKQFGGDGDQHLFDMKDVIESLRKNGLGNVADALGMPKDGDMEGIEAMEKASQTRKLEAIQKASNQMRENGGKYPGAHIVESAEDYVGDLVKGKLTWKLAIRDAIMGEGMKFKYDPEELGDPYFVEEIEEAVGVALTIGQDIPFKPDETVLVLIDTSGSVDKEDLRAFISEVMELKMASNGFGDAASEVVVLSADTVLRGEPVEITDQNAEMFMSQGVKIYGRGGTDLAEPIRQAAALDLFKDKKIRSLVYFSDLFASIPKFHELGLPEGTSVTYVSAPTTTNRSVEQEEAFRRGVEDYAVVVPIREGIEITLDQMERDAGIAGAEDTGITSGKRMKF